MKTRDIFTRVVLTFNLVLTIGLSIGFYQLSQELDRMDKNIDRKVNQAVNGFQDQLGGISTNLETKVNGVASDIESQLAGLGTNLEVQVDGAISRIESRLPQSSVLNVLGDLIAGQQQVVVNDEVANPQATTAATPTENTAQQRDGEQRARAEEETRIENNDEDF